MKNKLLKIGIPTALIVAGGMFYFSALEHVQTTSTTSTKSIASKNAFKSNATPYVGVKLPAEGEVYVEVASKVEEEMLAPMAEGDKIYFAPGSFDHKRIDKQAVKNQRKTAKAMAMKELNLIEHEIASDEVRLQELMEKGDSANVAYLEALIDQKKTRYEELRYQ